MTRPANSPKTNTSKIGVVFRKEFGEIFRERRTLMRVVISPLVLTPALFALMGHLVAGQAEKARTETYTIGVVSAPHVSTAFLAAPGLRLVPVTRKDAEAEIRTHRLEAAVVLPADLETRLSVGGAASVEILEDAGDKGSQDAAGRLRDRIDQAGQTLAAQRLASKNLPSEFAAPYKIQETPIKSGGSAGMLILSSLLPYMLIISAFSGTIYAAFDQVAGEKERGTLETLLVSPASRRDIVLGKFCAVVMVCLISSILTIIGLGIAFAFGIHIFVHLSAASVVVILLTLLPISVLFGGLLLTVSTYARNQKEAMTLLAPLFTLIMIPAIMSMVISTNIAKSLALAPILNAALIIKQALAGNFDLGFIALAFLTSIVYAGLTLGFVLHLFQKESVLIKA